MDFALDRYRGRVNSQPFTEGTFHNDSTKTTMPDEPREYVFFLDYDEEYDATNVFAAVTNYGLYGDSREHYGIDKEPGNLFRDPNAKYIQGATELEGFGAVFFHDDSGVNWCGASREYLGPEIPEAVARKLHPRLFERIDTVTDHQPA